MTSERRSVEGELPDGIADRAQGYTHNPNPEDEIAANRARFEAKQRELQADHEAVVEAFRESQLGLQEEYEDAQNDPEHQAMKAEQRAHQLVDPAHERGGQDLRVGSQSEATLIANTEAPRVVPGPQALRRPEDFKEDV